MRATLFLSILVTFFAIFTILCFTYSIYYSSENRFALAQQATNSTQQQPSNGTQHQLIIPMGVKIDYPVANQKVPVGRLNISGSSSDTASIDCGVYVDVNDIKPFQRATATGPRGQNDYSNWTFTYTEKYKLITEGTNELTAKLSCNGNDTMNNTSSSNITNSKSKWYSINLTGVAVQEPVDKAQTQSSDNTQEQKIAILINKKLNVSTQEGAKSEEDIAPEIDSTTESDSLNSPAEVLEEISSTPDSTPSTDTMTEDYLTYKKERLEGEESGQEVMYPLQIFELPNEDEVGAQLMEDFQDVDSEDDDKSLAHQDDLEPEIQAEPEEQTELQPPLQFFDTDNQKQETDEDNEQVVQPDNNAIQSTEDIYAMITGDSDEGDNLEGIEKSTQERGAEDVIAKEIPLVQSYTRDIQSTFE
jgi:hypothetical protein